MDAASLELRTSLPGQLQAPFAVGDQPAEELLSGRRVVPVQARGSLDAGREEPPQALSLGPRRRLLPRQPRQHPAQLGDAVRDQVVRVLHRAAPEDDGRVQHRPHLPAPQVASLPCKLETASEDPLRLLVKHELRPEQLQRALGEGALVQLKVQRDLPAQVQLRPTRGFRIRHPVMGLQQQREAQQPRRHAVAPVVRAVQCGEVRIPKQLAPVHGEEPAKAVLAHEPEVLLIGGEQPKLR